MVYYTCAEWYNSVCNTAGQALLVDCYCLTPLLYTPTVYPCCQVGLAASLEEALCRVNSCDALNSEDTTGGDSQGGTKLAPPPGLKLPPHYTVQPIKKLNIAAPAFVMPGAAALD
eukprot:6343792-Pyramimonas_sp.AAC.1